MVNIQREPDSAINAGSHKAACRLKNGTSLKKTLGSVLAVIGALGALIGAISIWDPIGSQMANDSAPFAQPASVGESLLFTLGWVLLAAYGVWLFRRASR